SGQRASEGWQLVFTIVLAAFWMSGPWFLGAFSHGWAHLFQYGGLLLVMENLYFSHMLKGEIAVTRRGDTAWRKGYLSLDLPAQAYVDAQEWLHRFTTKRKVLKILNEEPAWKERPLSAVGIVLARSLEEFLVDSLASVWVFIAVPMEGVRSIRL